MFQILKIIICSYNELTQCPSALFTSPNENKLIDKYLWWQQRKSLHHIFQQHKRPNCNIIFFEHLKKEVAFHLLLLICWYQHCSPSHDNSLAKQQIVENNTSQYLHEESTIFWTLEDMTKNTCGDFGWIKMDINKQPKKIKRC